MGEAKSRTDDQYRGKPSRWKLATRWRFWDKDRDKGTARPATPKRERAKARG